MKIVKNNFWQLCYLTCSEIHICKNISRWVSFHTNNVIGNMRCNVLVFNTYETHYEHIAFRIRSYVQFTWLDCLPRALVILKCSHYRECCSNLSPGALLIANGIQPMLLFLIFQSYFPLSKLSRVTVLGQISSTINVSSFMSGAIATSGG